MEVDFLCTISTEYLPWKCAQTREDPVKALAKHVQTKKDVLSVTHEVLQDYFATNSLATNLSPDKGGFPSTTDENYAYYTFKIG